MSNPIRQRRMQANYLKVPNEATPQLLGVGAKTLNENPAAQTKSRRYVCDSSTTRSISGYDWSTAYEIDQIRIVMPNELEELAIDPRKDYLTLVTCTPYGINSHRMLVRGHRIDNPDAGEIRVTSDASQIEPLHVLPVVIGIIAAIMLIVMLVTSHRSNQNIKAYRNFIAQIAQD